MLDVMLISLVYFIMLLGTIIYEKQTEKYYKKHCTLKVEAHIVERKRLRSNREGLVLGLVNDYFVGPVLFTPVFAVDIDGTEHLIEEKKKVWTDSTLNFLSGTERFLIADKEPTWIDRPLEEYPHLMLWVNPQNTKQFRYDDERMERARNNRWKGACILIITGYIVNVAFVFAFR